MANNDKEHKTAPEIKQEENMEHNTKSLSSSPKNKSFVAAGAAVIALGALATALYTLSLNQQLQNQLTDKDNQLSSQLEQLEQKQDKTTDLMETKNNNIEETRTVMQAQFDNLNKQLQIAMSQKFYQNQNWILLKARYYLELAQINAHWSSSFSSTIALLQQADQLIQQLNDPKIFDIRQAIAKDIALLQSVPQIDIAGILSQLDAAQLSLNTLTIPSTLSNNKSEPETTPTPTTPQDKASVWRLHLQDSISLLNKLVIIRRNDEDIKPLISPAFEAILKENIRLNLQEAQWAVLNSNPQVYQLVLNQAITMLKKDFNAGAQNTAALIQKLSELQQIQLIQKRPEVGQALPLLNQLIEVNESTTTKPETSGQGGNS